MSGEVRVGVVVVHYGTDDLTLRCLRALLDDTGSPPRRIVLVDNGPGEGVAARVRAELPEVTVVVPGRNTGFAGGCNRGIAALGPIELVALVNSDVLAPPGWLTPLVAALDADPEVAAAVPKVLLEGRFHELVLDAAATWRPGRGDGRALAWQPRALEVDGEDVLGAAQLVEGFWEPGRGGRWAGSHSVLRVPAGAGARVARLQLATPPRRPVDLTVNGGTTVHVEPGTHWCELPLEGDPVTVIANAGNVRDGHGYGADRGWLEVDRGQYDTPADVVAWSGGAVLLRSTHLEEVGRFDERLFLYYEDLELSLRGAAAGWRFRYEPASVVEHRQGSSASRDVTRSERLKERNRLLVVARHDGLGRFLVELARFVGITLAYVRREIVAPPLRGDAPCGWLTEVRGLALAGALVRAPGMLRSRVGDRWRRRRGMPPLA
jgi:GT2 family glycosyltransferase